MKKSNLVTGIVFVLVGIVLLGAALQIDSKLNGLLFGFGGAAFGPGLVMICKFFYWSTPENQKRYEERMEVERIEMHDELKIKLRNQSGRYTYVLGLIVISLSVVLFSILGTLGIIEHSRIIVLYLSGYLVFQYVAGIVIFNYLLGKF